MSEWRSSKMQELIVNIAPNLASKLPDFYKALGDTMLMVLWSGLISFVFGLLLGVVLTVTKPNGILENKVVYQILDKLVSLFRSIPFIILLTWVMPITRALARCSMCAARSCRWCSAQCRFSPVRSKVRSPSSTAALSRRRSRWARARLRSSSACISRRVSRPSRAARPSRS